MKLIVGLGNPGKEYEGTRHNAGFYFLERLGNHPDIAAAGEETVFVFEKKFESDVLKTARDGEALVLAKPRTFMNLSGRAVQKLLSFYKIATNDLIVVSDDIDLPLGAARVRAAGSSGGQKGLESIIQNVGTKEFLRIRIGIGREADTDPSRFVLSSFKDRERKILQKITDEAIEYLLPYLGKREEKISSRTLKVAP